MDKFGRWDRVSFYTTGPKQSQKLKHQLHAKIVNSYLQIWE